jgi:LPS export ABC transporter protein LptC
MEFKFPEMILKKVGTSVINTSLFSRKAGHTVTYFIFLVLFVVACTNDKPEKIGAIIDRSKMPKLHATEISTIISDSGITRYRISAPVWDVYDKSSQPYWEFPKGIHFERFDQNMKVDANIHCLYAKFYQNLQIWELRKKVRSTNLQGELFETEHLFWDQRQERFYSDTLIKVTQATRIITGIGFVSNQTMTKYVINRPQGIFPVDENRVNAPSQPIAQQARNTVPVPVTRANPVTTQPTNTVLPQSVLIFPKPGGK